MKKVNVILGVVLAMIIMFNIGAVMYERGNQEGYYRGYERCEESNDSWNEIAWNRAWDYGYEAGINDYSDYVDEQKALEAENKLKNAVKEVATFGKEEEL